MLHRRLGARLVIGPSEWLGECLRMLTRAKNDRPVDAQDVPTDWRFDWTHHHDGNTEPRREHRISEFE